MPKISVIVPVYNSEEFLKDCLDSLVEQTEKDIEIIAIDDCSTDRSLELLKEYAIKYPNIKVYQNDKNEGQSKTRNEGIAIATGEYITFLDSDDYINPKMYKELYEIAEKYNKPELITTGLIFVKGNEYRKEDLSYLGSGIERIIKPMIHKDEIYSQSPSVCNKLFRSDTVKNYGFLKGCMWEDIAFSFTRFLEATTVIDVPSSNYFYRRNIKTGVSARNYRQNDKIDDIFKVADELEEELKRNGRYDIFKEQITLLQVAICLQRANEVNYWDTTEEEKEAIKNRLFSETSTRYGGLDEIDSVDLQCKVDVQTVDEYSNFLKKQSHKQR